MQGLKLDNLSIAFVVYYHLFRTNTYQEKNIIAEFHCTLCNEGNDLATTACAPYINCARTMRAL